MTHRTCLPVTLAALCLMLVWTAAPAAAQEPGPDMSIDRLHHQIMTQLVAVWTQMAQLVGEDGDFLATGQWESLMARQQALIGLRYAITESLRGPEPEGMNAGAAGTFQFISWIELDRRYWVLDTRTGQMHPRACPPPPEDDRERDDG